MCIRISVAEYCSANFANRTSYSKPLISLMMVAPAWRAASATEYLMVSIEIGIVGLCFRMASIIGITRRNSYSA